MIDNADDIEVPHRRLGSLSSTFFPSSRLRLRLHPIMHASVRLRLHLDSVIWIEPRWLSIEMRAGGVAGKLEEEVEGIAEMTSMSTSISDS